ncbi:Dnl2 protein-like protein [Ochromonadaceae sp. CCMP2298]|nr:Dnl2 protein-like protein [Ochromonadaceae sp. CCMP2298]
MSARPVVKTSHMNASMQEFAIMSAQDAIANFTSENEIAASIKQKFEQQYPSTWHCFIGRNFGCFVTHEASKFIYFYIGQTGICLFATA